MNLTTAEIIKGGKLLISNGILARDNKEVQNTLNFMRAECCFLLLGPPKRKWPIFN
ncbi:hypothetical protein [Gottfriedia luciferensis]|uniref:hypothetical protein n=1 Tax=Gottfriedia luciferensis TaxID=178774 RepID=UPI0038B2F54A